MSMEWSKNEEQQQQPKSTSKASTKSDKSSTRLRKRAPPPLHLDAIRNPSILHPSSFSSYLSPIPFLSPISLFSPIPFLSPVSTAPHDVFSGQTKQGGGGGGGGRIDEGPPTPTPTVDGWHHPPTSLTQTSKLFAMFRSQCSLVNQTQ